jgi:excisionase family DNA binding protein
MKEPTSPPAAGQARYFNVAEAARYLGVSPSTIWRWIDAGKLAAYRIGPRGIRIRDEDVQAAIQPARPASQPSVAPPFPLPPPPTAEELERRKRLVAEILEHRKHMRIAPLTAADLVHLAREEAFFSDDPDH